MKTARDPRVDLAQRLLDRRTEIEQAVFARLQTISAPERLADPEYRRGLAAAVEAGVRYGLAALERGEERIGPIPGALLEQARQAARNGVGLETVLRRYLAGSALLGEFLMRATTADPAPSAASIQPMLRTQAVVLDRVLLAVSDEYQRALGETARPGVERRRSELVKRLLSGEQLDAATLDYELTGNHVAAIAWGTRAESQLGEIAQVLDRRLLLVRQGGDTLWAWFGGRRVLTAADLLAATHRWEGLALVVGEAGDGLSGWRLSHWQARAAWPICRRGNRCAVVRYADVALLASVLHDGVLVTFLRKAYLEPLWADRRSGNAHVETLRAYFAVGRNTTSAAASLGVSRRTITNRLNAIERRLGRPLETCIAELEVALRLEELSEPVWPFRD